MADERQPEPIASEQLLEAQHALAESLEERNRLWEEVQRLKALQHENEYLRRLLADLEGSISWRMTTPLRALMRASRELETKRQAKKQD